jgi:hypothetical protein
LVIDLPGLAILSVAAHEKAGFSYRESRMIAIGGEWGTLSEIGFARVIGHEVVALRSWERNGRERMSGGPGVVAAETAEEAVAAALAAL